MDSKKGGVALVIILAVWFLLWFLLFWFINRKKPNPILTTIEWWVIFFFVCALLFSVAAIIWWFIRPRRVDMVKRHKERIIESCMLNQPPFKQELWFSGTEKIDGRKVGDVVGISYFYAPSPTDPDTPALYWLIAFKVGYKKDVFFGLHDDFNGDLNGSRIWLKGSAFAPNIYGMQVLGRSWLRSDKVDFVIKENIKRYVLEDFLSEFKVIIDETLQITPSHIKAMQKSHMQEIKQVGGDQPTQKG